MPKAGSRQRQRVSPRWACCPLPEGDYYDLTRLHERVALLRSQALERTQSPAPKQPATATDAPMAVAVRANGALVPAASFSWRLAWESR